MSIKQKPNILWICTDGQRFDTLGCYGNPFAKTPVLDELASDSVLFENAFTQSPACTPSRGSFLTGRYPVTSRLRQNGTDISESEILVTRLFHEEGYYSGLAGKLRLSSCGPAQRNERERRINDGYDEFYWAHDQKSHKAPYNEYIEWLEKTHHESYRSERLDETPWVEKGMSADKSHTHWCVEKAIAFIKAQKGKNRPWLFSVNLHAPCHPFDPPEEYFLKRFERLDDIPLPRYVPGEEEEKPIWQSQDTLGAHNNRALFPCSDLKAREHRLIRAAYWAQCDLIDREIARLLEVLDETDQRSNTIIVFMSDHGEMLGDHGIYLNGPFFYDCAVKVPLIVHWQDNFESGRRDGLVELNDLPQTLLELCDINFHEGMQGASLAPMLEGKTSSPHDSVYCEYLNAMSHHSAPKAFATMVRTKHHKLVAAHSDQSGELYDLDNDPFEHVNLYNSSDYLAIKAELLERLLHHWSCTADPLPVRRLAW